MTEPIKQYEVLKINVKHFIKKDENGNKHIGDLTINKKQTEQFKIKQDISEAFYQLERLRGFQTKFLEEVIYLEARHDKAKKELYTDILKNGLVLNGKKYLRFGKSNSQAKDGITVFIQEKLHHDLMQISNLDFTPKKIVISKYESYRNLIFSSSKLIDEFKLPYIVIVGEYTKVIPNQYIRYVVRSDEEYTDEKTGEVKKYEKRSIQEGYKDLEISPFDGCACHTPEIGLLWNEYIGKKYYTPCAYQIRLAFMKGLSVEVDFKRWYKEKGITEIKDVFGNFHKVENIDCLWNVSMWKGYKYFKDEYGDEAWNVYLKELDKHEYKLGISKYSHHMDNMDLNRRFNFQYLQTLDLINDKYVEKFKSKDNTYDILDNKNNGKMIGLAKYSTDLFEKVVHGDEFYAMKFLGINDTEKSKQDIKYLEAVKINRKMLKDPIVSKTLRNITRKSINQMKFGKIYVDGFYHTICGDMKAYLEYCGGLDVFGCLKEWEVHTQTLPVEKATLFRSPCVCSSEISNVKVNNKTEFALEYMPNLSKQDVIMFSANDILMPQLGGADADGDVAFMCTNEIIYNAKIKKPIIIDIEDKATAIPVEYNIDNITEYELNSRDSRIGEITNIATSILNNYTEDEKRKKINDENISLLRIYQGKEIDFIKTGKRWVITKSLRKNLQKLPYFIMHNYPKKMKVYEKRKAKNKELKGTGEKVQYNAFHSPTPMQELCDYIETWERKEIQWSKIKNETYDLLYNHSIPFSKNDPLFRTCREINDKFSKEWTECIREDEQESRTKKVEYLFKKFKKSTDAIVVDDKDVFINYFIHASNYRTQINKQLCWELYGDVMLENIKTNTTDQNPIRIVECNKEDFDSYEFLGKYYKIEEIAEENIES